MKLVKVSFQTPNAAHETLYIIRGWRKKKIYQVNENLGVYELPLFELKDEVKNEASK